MNRSILTDVWAFLQTMTGRKWMNAMQLFFSFYASRLFSKPLHLGMPMSMSIEPTTACNLRCPECPSGLRQFSRSTGNIAMPLFENVLNEVHSTLISILFYFQGEPFIHPQITNMVRLAVDKGLYTMISTNGHFLDRPRCEQIIRSGLHRIIISMDGINEEQYLQYRKEGDFQKLIQGIQNLVETRKQNKSRSPLIVLQCIVFRHNEHSLHQMKSLAEELGVDKLQLKSAQVYQFEQGSNLIPEQEIYSRYKKDIDQKYSIKSLLFNHCWRMWSGCVMTWDGLIVPCCFDKDAQHRLGSVPQDGFREVWKSEIYSGFRSKILLNRKGIDICTNCTEGGRFI